MGAGGIVENAMVGLPVKRVPVSRPLSAAQRFSIVVLNAISHKIVFGVATQKAMPRASNSFRSCSLVLVRCAAWWSPKSAFLLLSKIVVSKSTGSVWATSSQPSPQQDVILALSGNFE